MLGPILKIAKDPCPIILNLAVINNNSPLDPQFHSHQLTLAKPQASQVILTTCLAILSYGDGGKFPLSHVCCEGAIGCVGYVSHQSANEESLNILT